MTRLAGSLRSAYAAALCALALLSFAQVRSNVMQAQMSPVATHGLAMGDMAMGDMTGAGAAGKHAPAKGHKTCEFCAAAAHAPLVSTALPAPAPVAFAWPVAPVRRTLGPRGPPLVQPRARGPPPLTA